MSRALVDPRDRAAAERIRDHYLRGALGHEALADAIARALSDARDEGHRLAGEVACLPCWREGRQRAEGVDVGSGATFL